MTQSLFIAFDVPAHLKKRLLAAGFRPSKKRPQNWWRIVDPDKPEAKRARSLANALRLGAAEYPVEADPRIIALDAAKERRQEAEAAARHREEQRQSELRAAAEARHRAEKTLRRSLTGGYFPDA